MINPTLKPQPVFGDVRGMVTSMPEHLLPANTWSFADNVQFRRGHMVQTPPDVETSHVTPSGTTALAVLVKSDLTTLIMGLSASAADGCEIINLDGSTTSMGTLADTGTVFDRFTWVTSGGVVYFTTLATGVYFYPGTTAPPDMELAITAGTEYAAKYIEIFHGHLVLANLDDSGTGYPLRVAWSDKDDFQDFDPLTTNEADFFELDDNAYNALFGYGITGCRCLGDLLVVHTAGSIWIAQYVGFEAGVMIWRQQVTGLGCWLPYALIAFDRFHVFPARDNFYMFDGVSLRPIGDAIRSYFYNNLSTDPKLRSLTWGTVDIDHQELRWYFPSRASNGTCDKCLVFNWVDSLWYVEDGFNRSCVIYAGQAYTLRTIDGLSVAGSINNLPSIAATIDDLGGFAELSETYFATFSSEFLHRDLTEADVTPLGTGLDPYSDESDTRVIVYPVSTLITRDFVYGAEAQDKEIRSLRVDADVRHKDEVVGNRHTQTTFDFSGSSGVFSVDFNDFFIYTTPDVPFTWSYRYEFAQHELFVYDEDDVLISSSVNISGNVYEVTIDHAGLSMVFITTSLTSGEGVAAGTMTITRTYALESFGWDVFASVRDCYVHDVNFESLGRLSGSNTNGELPDVSLSGNVIRYKFVSRDLFLCRFMGYTTYSYAGTTENKLT